MDVYSRQWTFITCMFLMLDNQIYINYSLVSLYITQHESKLQEYITKAQKMVLKWV